MKNNALIHEWEERVKQIPVKTIKDDKLLRQYVTANHLGNEDVAVLLTIVATSFPQFSQVSLTEKEGVPPDITFGELLKWYDMACTQFLIIHRVYFIIHEAMIAVYDILEKEKRLKFMVKKYSKMAEDDWERYEAPRRTTTQREAWFTLQDHLRIANEMLAPRIEKVFESIRDYMIRLGWRDIEIQARIETALLISKVGRHSFRGFFKDFIDACGVDFSECFELDNILLMEKHFAAMSDALGFRTEADRNGGYDVRGIDCNKSQRVQWAWEDFIKDLRDDDLMDESAIKAIRLNPTIEADYKRQIEEDEKAKMEASTKKLGEKFKVIKKKQ